MSSRYIDYKFVRYGKKQNTMQHYRVWYLDKYVAEVIRTGKNYADWYVIPSGWFKGVGGFRTKMAVFEFLQQFVVDDPWWNDPTTKGYSEYSIDRVTWDRTRMPGAKYHRYVGVTLTIELRDA